jgi:hypothetical protein
MAEPAASAPHAPRPPVAVWLLGGLLAASVCAWDSGAHRSFFVPKLLLTYASAVAALGLLVARGELRWPGPRAAAWTAAAFAALSLLSPRGMAPELGWIELSVLACGAVLLLAAAQLSGRERRVLLAWVVAAASLQLAIALLQGAGAGALLPAALQPRVGDGAFGSVGNPEFLSTLLGVAAVLAVDLLPPAPPAVQRWRVGAIVGALLLGLLAARNKGGLALVGAWLLWRALAPWPRARPWILGAALAAALALVALFAPGSVRGRALLWLASGQVIADHPWLGVGAGRFQDAYLPAVQALFSHHPRLAAALGSHTAQVDDAHDLLLHSWASLGGVGLAAAVALLAVTLRIARGAGVRGWALGWLAAKSLYTVVLGSLSGAILWALLLGLGPLRWPPPRLSRGRRWWLAVAGAVALAPAGFGVRSALADRAYRRGMVADAEGNGAAALSAFQEAIAWQPGFAEAHLGEAHVHFDRGEREEMDHAIEAALSRGRTFDLIKISAHMRFYSHLYAEAEPLYAFLHQVFPEHLTSMAKLALIRLDAGDLEGARAMARELLASRPRHRNDSDPRNREIARRILEGP